MKYPNDMSAVLQLAAKDETFQKCWRYAAEKEEALVSGCNALSEAQQALLDDYITARQDLALAIAAAAYAQGLEQGKQAAQ